MSIQQMIEDFNNIYCPDFTDENMISFWCELLGTFALGYNAAQKPNVSKPRIRKVDDSGVKPQNIYDTLGMIEPEAKEGSEDE